MAFMRKSTESTGAIKRLQSHGIVRSKGYDGVGKSLSLQDILKNDEKEKKEAEEKQNLILKTAKEDALSYQKQIAAFSEEVEHLYAVIEDLILGSGFAVTDFKSTINKAKISIDAIAIHRLTALAAVAVTEEIELAEPKEVITKVTAAEEAVAKTKNHIVLLKVLERELYQHLARLNEEEAKKKEAHKIDIYLMRKQWRASKAKDLVKAEKRKRKKIKKRQKLKERQLLATQQQEPQKTLEIPQDKSDQEAQEMLEQTRSAREQQDMEDKRLAHQQKIMEQIQQEADDSDSDDDFKPDLKDPAIESLLDIVPYPVLKDFFKLSKKTDGRGRGSRFLKSGLIATAFKLGAEDLLDGLNQIETIDCDYHVNATKSDQYRKECEIEKFGLMVERYDHNFTTYSSEFESVKVKKFKIEVTFHKGELKTAFQMIPLTALETEFSSKPHPTYLSKRFGKNKYVVYTDPKGLLREVVKTRQYDFNLPDPDALYATSVTKIFSQGFGLYLRYKHCFTPINEAKSMLLSNDWAHYYFARMFFNGDAIYCYDDLNQLCKKGLFSKPELIPTIQAFCNVAILKKFYATDLEVKNITAKAVDSSAAGAVIREYCRKKQIDERSANIVRILQHLLDHDLIGKNTTVTLRAALEFLVSQCGELDKPLSPMLMEYWAERMRRLVHLSYRDQVREDVICQCEFIKHIIFSSDVEYGDAKKQADIQTLCELYLKNKFHIFNKNMIESGAFNLMETLWYFYRISHNIKHIVVDDLLNQLLNVNDGQAIFRLTHSSFNAEETALQLFRSLSTPHLSVTTVYPGTVLGELSSLRITPVRVPLSPCPATPRVSQLSFISQSFGSSSGGSSTFSSSSFLRGSTYFG